LGWESVVARLLVSDLAYRFNKSDCWAAPIVFRPTYAQANVEGRPSDSL
jgi:hypothetical protein